MRNEMEGYTIQSAQFVNAELTAIVLRTAESGAVLISEIDRPALWAHALEWISKGNTVQAYVAPVVEQPRDPIAELDKLTSALIAKSVVSEGDITLANDVRK
jgi:hypothetical protein